MACSVVVDANAFAILRQGYGGRSRTNRTDAAPHQLRLGLAAKASYPLPMGEGVSHAKTRRKGGQSLTLLFIISLALEDGSCRFFRQKKKEKKRKKRDSPKHSPHLARLSSFSSFFQIILWHKALAALYLRNPK